MLEAKDNPNRLIYNTSPFLLLEFKGSNPVLRSYLPLLFACLLAAFVTKTGFSQAAFQKNQSQAAQPKSLKDLPPVEAKTERLRKAVEELRVTVKGMRESWVRFNSALNIPEQKKWKAKWYELLPTGHQQHQEMLEAAAAEFALAPAQRPELAGMLYNIVDDAAEKDRLDGLLPIAETLLDNGVESKKLLVQAAFIAFAMCEFEKAKKILDICKERGIESERIEGMREQVDFLPELWKQELAYRESDAAGEPLPRVLIRTTKGDIEAELFENQAPDTVGNFISLVEEGFYEGLQFHRVIEHFMAQTGCPNNDGSGDADYTIYNEGSLPNARLHWRGTLAMAMSPEPNSGSSQFYICYVPTPFLNNDYAAFGRVTKGMNILSDLVKKNPEEKKKTNGPAKIPDEIIEIKVLNKRDHEYKPNKVALP